MLSSNKSKIYTKLSKQKKFQSKESICFTTKVVSREVSEENLYSHRLRYERKLFLYP